MAEVDEILRAVTRLFPEELVRALTHPGAMVRFGIDVLRRQRIADLRDRGSDRCLAFAPLARRCWHS